MGNTPLHETYAPILHFARNERFFPMAIADFVAYAALYRKGKKEPAVAAGRVDPRQLARSEGVDTFLCSVPHGPLPGIEVAKEWSTATLKMLYQWGRAPSYGWTAQIAKGLYDWFSDKTSEATRRFWWNDLLLRGDVERPIDRGADLPRFRLPRTIYEQCLANYEQSRSGSARLAYYHRTVRSGEYLNLQYWFFYSYNDWAQSFGGFNDHEGDWEGLHLFFRVDANQRPIEPPAHICYMGHHSRITKAWNHPDVTKEGTHPHVYVAAGSHASYPERKPYTIMSLYGLIDQATGDGRVITPDDWSGRIDLEGAPWIGAYPGSWGTRYWISLGWLRSALAIAAAGIPREITLPGVSAPRGPRFDDAGGQRETWGQAARFAGLDESL